MSKPRKGRLRLMQFFKKRRTTQQHHDSGMTLPELLVSVTLTGILMSSLALATNVMLSNHDNTLGRANNSRSEQNVGLFMPTDLASSESENTDPDAVPCGPESGADHLLGTADDVPAPPCPPGAVIGGSNALLLTWTGSVVIGGNAVATLTKVSYRVVLVGTEYQLVRVKCDYVGTDPATCNTQIVLHDLTPPPVGVTFVAGVTPPDWIMTVSKATDPLDASGPSAVPVVDPGLKNKNGQRVVVTVNGGGGGSSASGGQSQIFLSAGGTDREAGLATDDLSGAPTFTAARSRCGGNIGMVVDTSGSISPTQMQSIKGGIQNFLNEFAGTPVKLEVVSFADTGKILGSSAAGEAKWYDMLVDADVAALKTLIGDPANASSGIAPGGRTNWEDAFLRMLRNVDGTVPAQMPSKVIFFTDGVPTTNRLNSTSSTAAVVANSLDSGLPTGATSNLSQASWNRAERVVRDRGKVDVIGIFVGVLPTSTVTHQPTTAYESWTTASAGYHFEYALGDTVLFQRGYHAGYQRGNNVVYERGSHLSPQVGNNVTFEKGFHYLYERNNNVVFERTTSTKLQYWKGSTSTNAATYFTATPHNTTPDSSDGFSTVVLNGGLGNNWDHTSPPVLTQALYDGTNTTVDESDGFRTIVNGSLSGSWTAVTQAQYDGSNTTIDSSDGWRATKVYATPFDQWETSTQAAFLAGNTNNTTADGWRTTASGTATTWTDVTTTQYNNANTTADATDGWQNGPSYSAPFSSWAPTTAAVYDAGNTNNGSSDGFRVSVSGTATSWSTVTQTQYNNSNTTADASDGWQVVNVYSSPFDSWENTTQAIYETAGNNSSSASTDGWKTMTSGIPTAWTPITQTQYNASNTTTDDTDGWRTFKAYSPPVVAYDLTTKPISAIDLLGNVVVGDLSGNTGSYNRVDSPPAGVPYAYNAAAAADVFALPDYTRFADALDKIVLGECGGTVTLQTKNTADNLGAKDPFTYQNSTDSTVVKTSAAFKSGTFDVAFPGENAKTITITPQIDTSLSAWSHAPGGWSCKSKAAAYPFTEAPVADHPGWTSITLTVHANEAISCTQMVVFHG